MNNDELIKVKGGVSKGIVLGAAGVIISFLIGVFDGYYRPLACNK
jgi:hypothetical protein